MGKLLKIVLAAAICVVGFYIGRTLLENAGIELELPRFGGAEDTSVEIEPFYEPVEDVLFQDGVEIVTDQEIRGEFLAESFEQVHIRVSQADLTLEMGQTEALVIETETVHRYQAYVEEGTLYIIIEGTVSAKSAVEGEGLLPGARIALPGNFTSDQGSLTLETVAAGAVLEGLRAETVELEVSAGTVGCKDLTVQTLTVAMTAGSVTGEDIHVTESSVLEMWAGSLSLSGKLTGEIGIRAMAGDMSLFLEEPFESYDCLVECSAGSVTLAGEKYSGLTSREEITQGGANRMEIECSLGVVTIDFSE